MELSHKEKEELKIKVLLLENDLNQKTRELKELILESTNDNLSNELNDENHLNKEQNKNVEEKETNPLKDENKGLKEKEENPKLTPNETNETEKISENEIALKNENEKLRNENLKLKLKYLNVSYENEAKITKYKNIIKKIEEQCKNIGIKFGINIALNINDI